MLKLFKFHNTGICKNTFQCDKKCFFIINRKLHEEKRVIFSGIQPTGIPHIGNYLGAIKHWINLQNEPGFIYYSIVDLHSITIPKDRSTLRSHILDMTACLLACGVDPKRSVVFLQSNIPEHAALAWAIGCHVPVNKLKHLPQWKEKSKNSKDGGYLGVFTYPVLQTADIILYKATHVPVGDDQLIHVQFSRNLVDVFNRSIGQKYFPQIKYFTTGSSGRIYSFRDPSVKMSKSSGSEQSRIDLTDSNDVIWTRLRRSVTDCASQVTYDPVNRPGVSNLIEIHCGFANITPEIACKLAEGLDTGQYKRVVADAVIAALTPIRDEYFKIRKDVDYLDSVLNEGSEKARKVATKNWNEVQRLIGMSS